MKQKAKRSACLAAAFLAAFGLWTAAVCRIDVRAIGPQNSSVGFAGLNGAFHDLTGVHMALYNLTDWLSLVPLGVIFGFALLGLLQWIRRKHLSRVDFSIFVLGGFYVVVLVVYVLFELVVFNYRPVLIGGNLEASYPSSTTMLVLCVMSTAMLQLRVRIPSRVIRGSATAVLIVFTVFMVIGRLLSGVHWLSDVVGGTLLSAGLVLLYCAICSLRHQ